MMSRSWEWECSACTFINTQIEHQSSCQMCLIERRRPWNNRMSMSSGMAMDVVESHDDAVVEMASTNHSLYNTANNANNWDASSSEPLRTEIEIGVSASANFFKSNDDDASAEQGEKNYAMNGRWDAFASLQANYESSSSDEDDDEGGDSNSSSDEVASNAGDSDCSDADFGDDCDIDGDGESHSDGDDYRDGSYHNDSRHTAKLTSQQPTNNSVECINLLDSDEDDIIATSGKENEKNIEPKSSRLRKRPIMMRHTTESSDSDSSLSEEEGRRHRQTTPSSPSTRGLPAWQPPRRRQSSSTPIQTQINNGNIKSSDQFPCMSIRNDVIGNAPSPCIVTNNNEAQMSKASIEEGRRQPSKKSSTSTKTASVASASRKKTRTTPKTAAAASSRGGAKKAPTKSRRRGGGKFRKRSTYKRSSAKSSSGSRGAESSNNSNNAWSERERGIRQSYRRGGGGGRGGGGSSTGPYMAIAKQEPMLRNVGGASIQF